MPARSVRTHDTVIHDFHSHTFLSDGCLSALELVRRATVVGYETIGVTDHVGLGSLSRVIAELRVDCALARAHWNIMAIPGVELTHVPPAAIADLAHKAKKLGASLVIVHGETLSEPVERGTNLAAVQCPYVDILAHPGTLSPEEARLASKNGVFIEITTRPSHRGPNADVARVAMQAGAPMLINSDAHSPGDLLTGELVSSTARAAGMDDDLAGVVTTRNPESLVRRLKASLA